MRKIKVAKPFVGEEEAEAVKQVLLSGNYVSGKKVEEFERKFAGYIGTEYAVALNSGTAALHLALVCLGIGPGDEVIIPPMTFFSTVSAVLYQGAVPVFADIDEDSSCLDPGDVEKRITPKTKAVIPVHLFGNAAEMDGFEKLAENYKLNIIEDAAQAHGTEYKGKKAGSMGRVNCFSFFATKNMTTGEGGMLTTNDSEIAAKARALRSHGMVDRNTHKYLGYNYRMSEINAAIGLLQLKKLDELNKIRIKNSEYLMDSVGASAPWLKPARPKSYVKHTYFWCPFVVDEEELGFDTEELIGILKEKGIETRHRYWEPLYRQQPFLDVCGGKPESLPNAEKFAGKIIGLPNHPALTGEDLDYIVEILKNTKL